MMLGTTNIKFSYFHCYYIFIGPYVSLLLFYIENEQCIHDTFVPDVKANPVQRAYVIDTHSYHIDINRQLKKQFRKFKSVFKF